MDFSTVASKDLYEMCLRGDEPAWGYVYRYVLVISRYWSWHLKDTPEDMAQGIVCHLLENAIEQVKKPEAFRSFIRRVAKNKILDNLKKKDAVRWHRNRPENRDGPQWEEPEAKNPGPDDTAYGKQLLNAFVNGLNALSTECREILQGYIQYKCGEFSSIAALADYFKMKIGSLSSRIKRCLDQLRKIGPIREWLEEGYDRTGE